MIHNYSRVMWEPDVDSFFRGVTGQVVWSPGRCRDCCNSSKFFEYFVDGSADIAVVSLFVSYFWTNLARWRNPCANLRAKEAHPFQIFCSWVSSWNGYFWPLPLISTESLACGLLIFINHLHPFAILHSSTDFAIKIEPHQTSKVSQKYSTWLFWNIFKPKSGR